MICLTFLRIINRNTLVIFYSNSDLYHDNHYFLQIWFIIRRSQRSISCLCTISWSSMANYCTIPNSISIQWEIFTGHSRKPLFMSGSWTNFTRIFYIQFFCFKFNFLVLVKMFWMGGSYFPNKEKWFFSSFTFYDLNRNGLSIYRTFHHNNIPLISMLTLFFPLNIGYSELFQFVTIYIDLSIIYIVNDEKRN